MGYTQHFYDKTHDASSELAFSLGVPVTDRLSVAGELSYDFAEMTFGESVGAEFNLADSWLAHADVGRADPSSSINWGVAITYLINDRTSVDLQVQDTTSTSPLAALSVNYAFGNLSR